MYYSSYIKASDAVDSIEATQKALVSGGTQGIGAGIALRFALAGASVWIIGRSEDRGQEVIKLLEQASLESLRRRKVEQTPSALDHTFFRADLSDVDEVKRVAGEVKQRAGQQGIDWLFETQGGPPVSGFTDTPKGIQSHFAVQCLSRFGLANELLKGGTIKRAVCLIAAPGSGGSSPLDTEDLELKKASKSWSMFGPMKAMKIGQIDSSILDAVSQDFAERYPNISISHLFPGVVAGTNAAVNAGLPFPFPQLSSMSSYVLPSAEQYSAVPFYLHATPEGNRYLRSGEANLFGPTLKRTEISKNVASKEVRQAVISKLTSYGF